MRDELGYIDLHEFTRAKMLQAAITAAEADCASCVVSHAKVSWESASDRVRKRLAAEQVSRVVREMRRA